MKLNMSSIRYLRGLLNNLVQLPKVLMIRCFMTRILQCTSLGSPCRQTKHTYENIRKHFLLASFFKLLKK